MIDAKAKKHKARHLCLGSLCFKLKITTQQLKGNTPTLFGFVLRASGRCWDNRVHLYLGQSPPEPKALWLEISSQAGQKIQLLRLENKLVSVVCLLPLVDDEETAELFGVFTVSLEEEVGVFEDFAVSLEEEEEAGVFGAEDGPEDLLGVTELRASAFPLPFWRSS